MFYNYKIIAIAKSTQLLLVNLLLLLVNYFILLISKHNDQHGENS